MSEALVSMRGIGKYIYGESGKALRNSEVKILDGVDFELRSGEVNVLVGENGAGKSTLMKVLGGVIPPDEGEILMDGHPVSFRDPREARAAGVAFIHQELNLCPNLDVAHNIFLGREPKRRGMKDASLMYARSAELIRSLSCDIDPREMVSRLSTAQQQVIEIAKAISFSSRVMIMDEPTASLTKREIDMLFGLIKRMRSEGMGIVYISHRFEEFLEIGDRVTVLRDGRGVGQLPMSEFDEAKVIKMMAGRSIDSLYPKTHGGAAESVLEVRGLRLTPRTPPIDIDVRAGEVVGLGGLVGSGRTELAKSVFGARRMAGGELRYLGRRLDRWNPRRAIAAGMAYLSEDRKAEGLVLGMNIRENVSLAALGDFLRFGLIAPRAERSKVEGLVGELSVVARSIEQPVATLSGGNQQRCVLAKWLATAPKLLILDEPTRGIDVGAKAQIHGLIDRIAAAGVAVLMISSELPELIGMSDRIYVMREGGVVAELAAGPDLTQERVVQYICVGCE